MLGLICMAIFDTPDLGNLLACWLPILYAGVLSCGIGYTLQVVAQADADPTAASLILSLESAFAAISGALVLHESMTLRQLLGCAVIFCAVILSNLPEKQAKPVSYTHLDVYKRQVVFHRGGDDAAVADHEGDCVVSVVTARKLFEAVQALELGKAAANAGIKAVSYTHLSAVLRFAQS